MNRSHKNGEWVSHGGSFLLLVEVSSKLKVVLVHAQSRQPRVCPVLSFPCEMVSQGILEYSNPFLTSSVENTHEFSQKLLELGNIEEDEIMVSFDEVSLAFQ